MNDLYAWVCNDRNKGDELICAIVFGLGLTGEPQTVPLVVSQFDMAMKLRPAAELHAHNSGKPVYLRRFRVHETLDTITP